MTSNGQRIIRLKKRRVGTLNQVPVAVKRIQLHDLEESFQIREETAMRKLDHPNVVKLLHVEENEDFK